MENVFFLPWVVRENYNRGYDGKKILVLGESHYRNKKCDKNCDCGKTKKCLDYTKNVVKQFLKYIKSKENKGKEKHEKWMDTFYKFTNVFLGKEKVNYEDLENFWNNIVFYNYVQKAMKRSKNKIERPTNDDFDESKKAFSEILEEYKPDLVIIWGLVLEEKLFPEKKEEKLSKEVKKEEELPEDVICIKYYQKLRCFNVDGKKIRAFAVIHPSLPFFKDYYHEPMQEALKRST